MKLPKHQKRTMTGVGIEPTSPESNTLTTRPRPLPPPPSDLKHEVIPKLIDQTRIVTHPEDSECSQEGSALNSVCGCRHVNRLEIKETSRYRSLAVATVITDYQASTLTAGLLARRLFLLGGPVRASGPRTPLARRGQRAYVRATRVFVLRWPEVQIRSRRRRHLSCFLAVGSFPSSFPANDKLIR